MYSVIVPALGSSPAEQEASSIPDAIRTLKAHADLGAPEPPHCSLSTLAGSGTAFETDESPERARRLTRLMRMQAIALRLHARRQAQKRCRRDHVLTPGNIYHGKNGDQCRLCRNESRRKVA